MTNTIAQPSLFDFINVRLPVALIAPSPPTKMTEFHNLKAPTPETPGGLPHGLCPVDIASPKALPISRPGPVRATRTRKHTERISAKLRALEPGRRQQPNRKRKTTPLPFELAHLDTRPEILAAAAVSPDFRAAAGNTIGQIVHNIQHPNSVVPGVTPGGSHPSDGSPASPFAPSSTHPTSHPSESPQTNGNSDKSGGSKSHPPVPGHSITPPDTHAPTNPAGPKN